MLPFTEVLSGAGALKSLWNSVHHAPVEPAPAPRSSRGESNSQSPVSEPVAQALRKIAARYDVTQITPRQFARMLEELQTTQALSETDLQQLGQVLFDLSEEGIDLDETVDLVQFYTKKLDKLQDSLEAMGGTEEAFRQIAPTLAGLQKRLDWISRLALLHSAPEIAGVNLVT